MNEALFEALKEEALNGYPIRFGIHRGWLEVYTTEHGVKMMVPHNGGDVWLKSGRTETGTVPGSEGVELDVWGDVRSLNRLVSMTMYPAEVNQLARPDTSPVEFIQAEPDEDDALCWHWGFSVSDELHISFMAFLGEKEAKATVSTDGVVVDSETVSTPSDVMHLLNAHGAGLEHGHMEGAEAFLSKVEGA